MNSPKSTQYEFDFTSMDTPWEASLKEEALHALQQMGQYWENEEEQREDMEELSRTTCFDDYQNWSDTTAIYPKDLGLIYTALGLASEAGEFAGKIKKMIRDEKFDGDAVVAELADVLWYVAQAASCLDVYLSDVAEESVKKLEDRKARDVLKGSGDTR
jgi:NTP pyrophosphatase (non-canonical NTP hydrolase)